MSEPFIGQIKLFAGNFAPRGFAFCDGQLLPIAQNSALFAIVGTVYGGDGRTTLGLPDLRGRVPLHTGSGPGLTARPLGSRGGTETEALTVAELPSHRHGLNAIAATSTVQAPASNTSLAQLPAGGRGGGGVKTYGPLPGTTPGSGRTTLDAASLAATGGGQAHGNIQPRLGVNYIIALVGTFPSRN